MTSAEFYHAPDSDQLDSVDSSLINLAEHRKTKSDRFPKVDDLLDRLTDSTQNVANGDYRAR